MAFSSRVGYAKGAAAVIVNEIGAQFDSDSALWKKLKLGHNRMNASIDWWATVKKLGLNIILGYTISWIYTVIAYFLLKPWIGKVRAAGLAYGSSWLVWLGATAALQALNPSGGTEKIEMNEVKGDADALS